VFTGIIKTTGRVAKLESRGGDVRLGIEATGLPWQDLAIGESIAVNGVCLTAVAYHAKGFDTDVSTETLAVTTLGALRPGSRVNLEPALAVNERLGGHFVSGHVDGTGTVRARQADGRAWRFEIELPPELTRYVPKKGSIAIDGVSLTINEVSGRLVSFTIIPHTLDGTIIGDYRVGTTVNIEVDMMARYLERLLGNDGQGGLTAAHLKAQGYG
jgi:riboflavin synthase